MNKKTLIFMIVLLAASIAVIVGYNGSREKSAASAPAAPVAFTTQDLNGGAVDQSIFTGHKLTMVNVWATYCGPCLSEMPELGTLSKTYADKGVQIVGVVSDVPQQSDGSYDAAALQSAQSLVKQTGADYTHLLPSKSLVSAMLTNVSAVPTTFFFDEGGRQLGKAYVGARSQSQWAKIVDGLLAQEAAA